VLKPRKPGFFGPDGQFIEAYEYQPEFGGDLSQAEKRWETEESDRLWADEENQRFNRPKVDSSGGVARAMWEHGKRIHAQSDLSGRPEWSLMQLLDKRRGKGGYAMYTHQTCLYFYRWKAQIQPDDPILDWSWHLVDAVMRFSGENEIRDHLVSVLQETSLSRLTPPELASLLGIRNREAERALSAEHKKLLTRFRDNIREGGIPSESSIAEAVSIMTRRNTH
jgi:hypothetical protein